MKLTLMIEGSAATIAAVLADLGKRNDGTTIATVSTEPQITPTGGDVKQHVSNPEVQIEAKPQGMVMPVVGAMVSPGGAPTPQMPAMGMPTAAPNDEDEDDGDTGAPVTGDVDAEGVRWDERIHSGGKAVTAKGVWKKKRGVSDDLVAQVVAEQRGGSAVTQQPAPVMPAMPQMAPVPSAAPVGSGMPGMPAAAPAAPAGPSFPEFMQTLSGQMQAGKISTEQVQWAAGQLELNAITDLGTQPEKIDKAVELFQQYGLWA